MPRSLRLIACLLLTSAPLSAQTPLLEPVKAGLAALEQGDCTKAFDLWTKSWTAPEEAANRDQLRGGCSYLAKLGKMHGYEILGQPNIGARIAYTYATLLYDSQPVFILLIAYQPSSEWKVMTVNWNTDARKVLPATLMPPGPVANPQ